MDIRFLEHVLTYIVEQIDGPGIIEVINEKKVK